MLIICLNENLNFRKSDKLPDPEEPKTCCPYCDNPTEESILVCASCKNLIPYCIVTVRIVSQLSLVNISKN